MKQTLEDKLFSYIFLSSKRNLRVIVLQTTLIGSTILLNKILNLKSRLHSSDLVLDNSNLQFSKLRIESNPTKKRLPQSMMR